MFRVCNTKSSTYTYLDKDINIMVKALSCYLYEFYLKKKMKERNSFLRQSYKDIRFFATVPNYYNKETDSDFVICVTSATFYISSFFVYLVLSLIVSQRWKVLENLFVFLKCDPSQRYLIYVNGRLFVWAGKIFCFKLSIVSISELFVLRENVYHSRIQLLNFFLLL